MNFILDSESQIRFILFRERGQIDVRFGKIDTLLRTDFAVVETLDFDGFIVGDVEDLEGQDAVVDIDYSALLNHFGEVFIVDIHDFIITFGGVYDKRFFFRGEDILRRW